MAEKLSFLSFHLVEVWGPT